MNLRRLKLIVDKLSQKYPPTFTEIVDHLQAHDLDVSERTIRRDIQMLGDDFNFVIVSKKKANQYYYHVDKETSLDLDGTISFLSHLELAEALATETTKYSPERRDEYISYYRDPLSSGVIYLKSIFQAIVQTRQITYSYKKYNQEVPDQKRVNPYFLKQQAKNWYLFAYDVAKCEFRTYGLDRLSDLNVTNVVFHRDASVSPKDTFNNMMGIFYGPNDKPIDILLKVTGSHMNLVPHVPIHRSQRIVEKNNDSVTISIHVVPNAELFTELLRYRHEIQILGPLNIAERLKEVLERMIALYSRLNIAQGP